MTNAITSQPLRYLEPQNVPKSEQVIIGRVRRRLDFGNADQGVQSSEKLKRLFEETLKIQDARLSRTKEITTFDISQSNASPKQ